jgi:hypothetical protein
MTFSNATVSVAAPDGLARLSDSSATTFGNNNKILIGSVVDLVGSGVCSVSTGVITLPTGFYYLLEGSLSAGDAVTGAPAGTRQIYTQFYDETAAAYIGTQSYQNGERANNFEDIVLFSKDDAARVWVDASGGARSISWKMQTVASSTYDRSDVIYNSPNLWVGYTRLLVWRFT